MNYKSKYDRYYVYSVILKVAEHSFRSLPAEISNKTRVIQCREMDACFKRVKNMAAKFISFALVGMWKAV